MRYSFVLPNSFDPLEFLPPRLAMRADDARWLMSTIVRKTAHRDLDIVGCARLHSDVLYRVLGDRAGQIVRALEAGGAIETTPYRAGGQTKGYRLARRYLGDRCVRVTCRNPLLLVRLAREQERMQKQAEKARARWLPIHHALDAEQDRLTIDPAADAILDTLPWHTRLCQDALMSRIRHREFPFSVSTTGRVFNGITGLKRELRPTLRIGGEPLAGVDVACAQPTLLALEMTRETPSNGPKGPETYKHTPPVAPAACPCPSRGPLAPAASLSCGSSPLALLPDTERYRSFVCFGQLYEHLVRLTGLERDEVKQRFLVDVLAKRLHPRRQPTRPQGADPAVTAVGKLVGRRAGRAAAGGPGSVRDPARRNLHAEECPRHGGGGFRAGVRGDRFPAAAAEHRGQSFPATFCTHRPRAAAVAAECSTRSGYAVLPRQSNSRLPVGWARAREVHTGLETAGELREVRR